MGDEEGVRSSPLQSPASKRGGEGPSDTLGFSNRRTERICEEGRSRYDEASVVHTDCVDNDLPINVYNQTNHYHSPACTLLPLRRPHGTAGSSSLFSAESIWICSFLSVSTTTTAIHLDGPHATHSVCPKGLNSFNFSELVLLPSYSDSYYQSLSLYQNLVFILNSFPLSLLPASCLPYPVSEQDHWSILSVTPRDEHIEVKEQEMFWADFTSRFTGWGERLLWSWSLLLALRMGFRKKLSVSEVSFRE